MSGLSCRRVGSAGIIVWRQRSRTIERLTSNNGVHFWRLAKMAERAALQALLFLKIFSVYPTQLTTQRDPIKASFT